MVTQSWLICLCDAMAALFKPQGLSPQTTVAAEHVAGTGGDFFSQGEFICNLMCI